MTAPSHSCSERILRLHALADGELDATHVLELEAHMNACADCAAVYREITDHKKLLKTQGVRLAAPRELSDRLLRDVDAHAPSRSSRLPQLRKPYFGAAASIVALAASVALFIAIGFAPGSTIDRELVTSHMRSLLAAHLTDVASSDRHTVKPWFLGKLDFAPPVQDLSDKGFPLIGGRLDYIGGRVVPALIYKRRGHVLNLFIWPTAIAPKAETATRDGYTILSWSSAAFRYAVVSDLNREEMEDFRHNWQSDL